MTIYHPEAWVALRMHNSKTDKTIYKIYAGWRGGFVDGDSWQLNSGIKSIDTEQYEYHVHGYSGSIYVCRKNLEGLDRAGSYIRGVLDNMLKNVPEHMEVSIVPMTEVKLDDGH